MKIQNTINRIQKYIDVKRYEKHQKDLNKFVSFHYEKSTPAIQELFPSRELLANYAKHNLVSIDVYDKTSAAKAGKELVDKNNDLYVRVTNLLNGKKAETPVSADTSVNYPKEIFRKVMVHDVSTGTEHLCNVKSSTEDTFLRNFYRSVEELTSKILKG